MSVGKGFLNIIQGGQRALRLLACLAILWAAGGTLSAQAQRPDAKASKPNTARTTEASSVFSSTCAGCHGLDGRGGEHGQNIASNPEVRRRTDAELLRILRVGIPEAGMPNFGALGNAKLEALVSYLRMLQGKGAGMPIPGDAQRGKSLFFGTARCSDCHMINGQGGFIGSDLSVYAADSSPEDIRRAIVNPESDSKRGRGLVQLTLRDGKVLEGVVRNEDNFSLQLQSLDGAFHFLQKADISTIKPSARALMPDNLGQTLSPAELDDIVGYLMTVALRPSEQAPKGHKRDRD
jgi:cytochrome c oxidase cbb3-type subunit 3